MGPLAQPVTRDFLLDVISNRDPRDISEHTVDTLVARLRRKMAQDGFAAPIATIRGIGYAAGGGSRRRGGRSGLNLGIPPSA